MAEYQRVLALRPDNGKAHQHIGHTYAGLGDTPRALEHLKLYVARYPNDADALNNLGAAFLGDRRPREALEPLARAIQVKPNHVLAHINAGYARIGLAQHRQALDLLRQAIALKYDASGAWVGVTIAYLELGDMKAARTAWGILGMLDRKKAAGIGPAFLQTW